MYAWSLWFCSAFMGAKTIKSQAHLRLLDCVEAHRSARHLEYHIQATQVLNFSFIDLHMLCVCA
jgi:hypothetical protein